MWGSGLRPLEQPQQPPQPRERWTEIGSSSALGDTHHERDGNKWRGEAKTIRTNVDRKKQKTTSEYRTPRKATYSSDTLSWNQVASCLVGFVCAQYACVRVACFVIFYPEPPTAPPSHPTHNQALSRRSLGGRCLTHSLQNCLWDRVRGSRGELCDRSQNLTSTGFPVLPNLPFSVSK